MKLTDQIEIRIFKIWGDNIKNLHEKNRWIDCIISPMLCAIILLVVYAIKGVYPFGINTVAYYDMPESYIPIYSYFWSVIHGRAGLYLNWFSGLCVSMADVVGNFLFFPTNLFFFFVKRENLLYSISYFLLIKMILSSLSISIYLKQKSYNSLGIICGGLLYAFSGFTLQYYTNIFYLDLVIIFPLIVLSFEKLLYEHKFRMFIFLMFLAFLTNVQLVFMIGIYLVYKGYFVLKDISNEKKGKSLRLFFFSTLIALLMAGFVLIPSILQTLSSSRQEFIAGYGSGYIENMKTIFNSFRKHKHFILYGSEMTFGVLILIIIKGKETIKKYISNIVMIILLCIPIIHEGINLLWHAGSYKHFPIRFGYMLTFECICLVCKFFKENKIKNVKYVSKIAKVLGISLIPFVGYVLYDYFVPFLTDGIHNLGNYSAYWIYYFTLAMVYLLSYVMETRQSRNFTIICVVLIQVSLGAYAFISPQYAHDDATKIEYLKRAIDLGEELDGTSNFGERIKTFSNEYMVNCSMILEQASIGSWLYGLASDTEQELVKQMGYDGMQSYVCDSGGTVFTDAFLGVKKIATSKEADKFLYNKNSKIENIYDSIYTLPFGIVVDGNKHISKNKSHLEHSNDLFRVFSEEKDSLIDISPLDDFICKKREATESEMNMILASIATSNETSDQNTDENNSSIKGKINNKLELEITSNDEESTYNAFELLVPIENASTLYLDKLEDFDGKIVLFVNGTLLDFKSYLEEIQYQYPCYLTNGILNLGSYEDEEVEIVILTENQELNGLEFGVLKHSVLSKGIASISKHQELENTFSKSGMTVSGKSKSSGRLILPVGYSDNWTASLNGKNVEIIPYLNGAFVSVEVPKGNINLNFKYIPKGLYIGMVTTAFGILLFILLVLLAAKLKNNDRTYFVLDKVFIYGYAAVFWSLIIFMYVIPLYIKLSL